MSTESNDPMGSEPTPEPGHQADPGPSMPATPPPPPPAAEPPPSYQSSAPSGQAAGQMTFDFASVPRSVWISFGGAIVLLVSVFFNWYTASISVNVLGQTQSASGSESGWDSGTAAKLIFLLALVAVVAWCVELFAPTVTLPFPAWMIAGACGALSLLLVLFKIVSKPGGADSFNIAGVGHASIGTAWGIWVALLAAIAVLIGAYLRMNESSA